MDEEQLDPTVQAEEVEEDEEETTPEIGGENEEWA